VGVGLLALTLVAMPVKYIGGDPTLVAIVGPVHGFLYMAYVVVAFDLGRRANWPLTRMLLVMLAGTVPFLSFVAERVVTRWTRAELTARAQRAGISSGTAAPR
jgi:integral membrane protein